MLSTWKFENEKRLDEKLLDPLNSLAPKHGLELGTCRLIESEAR